MSRALTLLDLLDRWGADRASRIAFRFLQSDESVSEEVTFAALRHRSYALARALAARVPPGSRALLLFETEPGFLYAFLGCLAARVLPVPADPPHGRRAWGGIDRIAADCRPAVILTTLTLSERWNAPLAAIANAQGSRVLTIEECLAETGGAGEIALPRPAADDVAFLQYTSGSTSHPKGVMVTHANVLANVGMIQDAFALSGETQTISWLPLFHDMGLIGFVLVPVYLGCTSTILSPAAFLEKPIRWLRAISRYRGTITSAPNFAYDLCVARIRPEDRVGVDLSTLSCALNGSEPVSANTLRRFQATFAEFGFQPHAFRPCYGMAEATLLITAIDDGRPVRVKPAGAGHPSADFQIESRDVVSCGRPRGDALVRIVDPATGAELPEGHAGEVWTSGSHVAKGYWLQDTATAETFADGFLRTGDLGCVDAGELFLMGRLKELLIIRGRNVPPRDVEEAVAGAHDAIRGGHVAAVGLVRGTEQELAIVAEIGREQWRSVDPQGVVDAILETVQSEVGLQVASVTLLRPGSLPKTTSGKLKRLECRRRLMHRTESGGGADWNVLHHWQSIAGARDPAAAAGRAQPKPAGDGAADVVLEFLRVRLAQALGCTPDAIADEEPFARLGLDSAVAVTLTGDLAEWLGLDLAPTMFWEHADPSSLAEYLAGLLADTREDNPVEHV